jgi:glutathione S-transferase
MNLLTFANPVFALYALAAGLMILKSASHSWLTAYRMLKTRSGFRLPEDLRKTVTNPEPHPDQLKPNDYVERTRRLHQNETENVPIFLVAGLLYVCTDPGKTLAAILFGVYVVSRFVHAYIVMSERDHETRAAAWTVGSIIIYVLSVTVVVQAVRALV